MSTPEPATGPVYIPDLMDYLKNGTDPVKMAEAELEAEAFRETGLDPRSYEASLWWRDRKTVTPRKPLRGDPPATMIFKAMGLIDEDGNETEEGKRERGAA